MSTTKNFRIYDRAIKDFLKSNSYNSFLIDCEGDVFRTMKMSLKSQVYKILIKETTYYIEKGEIKYNRFIIQQSTGYQDKSNQEIFEGDVVNDGQEFGEIIFEDGIFLVYYKRIMYKAKLENIYGIITIIGNIFKNE